MKSKFPKGTRSYTMSRIRSKDTKPEMIVRRFLYHNGFRYRLHVKGLPGKPDIVLHKYKTVIFVHGCFWHGHEGCKSGHIPHTNVAYWEPKIRKNKARDQNNFAQLAEMGYRVIVIYECELAPCIVNGALGKLMLDIGRQFPKPKG